MSTAKIIVQRQRSASDGVANKDADTTPPSSANAEKSPPSNGSEDHGKTIDKPKSLEANNEADAPSLKDCMQNTAEAMITVEPTAAAAANDAAKTEPDKPNNIPNDQQQNAKPESSTTTTPNVVVASHQPQSNTLNPEKMDDNDVTTETIPINGSNNGPASAESGAAATEITQKTAADTQKAVLVNSEKSGDSQKAAAAAAVDSKQPPPPISSSSRRSRTRSLSSAFSSLSGEGESVGENNNNGANNDPMLFDNNGKTPLRANRMASSSHGPVRKRHKKKGPRALFRNNESELLLPPNPSSQEVVVNANNNTTNINNNAVVADSTNNTAEGNNVTTLLPPPMENTNDGAIIAPPTPSSVTSFANNHPTSNRRSRSDTIDSFRAAMDSSSQRSRSNTIDSFRAAMDSSSQFNNDDHLILPTESILLPERLPERNDQQQGEDGDNDGILNDDLSNAKNVEDIIGSSSNNTTAATTTTTTMPNSPLRSRSDTIDFLSSSNNPLMNMSPRGRSDTMEFMTGSSSQNHHNHHHHHHFQPTSPLHRRRSDTIDFLTSAVEFQVDDDDVNGSCANNDPAAASAEIHPTPVGNNTTGMTKETNNVHHHQQPTAIITTATATTTTTTKRVEINLPAESFSGSNQHDDNGTKGRRKDGGGGGGGVAFGKTPKKTNRSNSGESSLLGHGPLRKRHRTRSLSFALSEQQHEEESKPLAAQHPGKTELQEDEELLTNDDNDDVMNGVKNNDDEDENDDYTESDGGGNSGPGRNRSNTLDSFHIHNAVFGGGGRPRSDTLDFLTAAVAGDYGHDLDAAMAAAADDGASYAMHTVSAPSGASARYNDSFRQQQHPSQPPTATAAPTRRPRSDTLDSCASSINSAKLDFLVSVAAEQGVLSGGGGGVGEMMMMRSGASENSSENQPPPIVQHQRRPRSNTLEIYSNMAQQHRARSDTVDFLIGAHDDDDVHAGVANIDHVVNHLPGHGDDTTEANSNVLDHLKALCDEPKINESRTARILRRKRRSSSDMTDAKAAEEGSGSTTVNNKNKKPRKNSEAASSWKTGLSQDSFMNNLTRNRLESWGGMSDLSAGGMGTIAATHTALKDTGILDDVLAAAADCLGGGEDASEGGGNSSLERSIRKIRTGSGGSNSLSGLVAASTKGRPRMDSLASLSLASLSDTSISSLRAEAKTPAKNVTKEVQGRPTKPSDTASVSTPSIIVDYDAIASAVHAVDGLDLAAILGTPSSTSKTSASKEGVGSNSTTQKAQGAGKPTNISNLPPKPHPSRLTTPLPKSYVPQPASKLPPPPVRSAMQKNALAKPPLVTSMPPGVASTQLQQANATPQAVVSGTNIDPNAKSPFPVASINIPFVPIPKSTKTKEEMDAIRERARAAAGYVPPGKGGKTPAKRPTPPHPKNTPSSAAAAASRFSPHLHPTYRPGMPAHIPIKKRGMPPPRTPMPDHIQSNNARTPLFKPPAQTPSSTLSSKSGTLQSQQKWDDMFECLVNFIDETREKLTNHMNEEQKAAWIWDGNVPTSYKTPCGKALGRWINNQRSAKAKGTLKDEREVRLVSTGLKWSVLTTNSWRIMLHELEIYVNEQTKDGRTWDGNVPTNYKIKSNFPGAPVSELDEEKNLGRWVNRQRSLFQSGKLKKDRQMDLERIGLKWSVRLTTSWSTMYENLCAYAEEKRKQSPHGWDGNVPANFKTRSNPPLSLGRWVNRQRSAHAKGRLKDEYVKKLDVVGLKWVIHARGNRPNDDDDDDFVGGEFIPSSSIQKSSIAPLNGATTTQGSAISNAGLPSLPPLGNSFASNAQAP
ncbi:hypothetical protein ACHAXR_010916 [Thalassiosira sp. AJA248-18]